MYIMFLWSIKLKTSLNVEWVESMKIDALNSGNEKDEIRSEIGSKFRN